MLVLLLACGRAPDEAPVPTAPAPAPPPSEPAAPSLAPQPTPPAGSPDEQLAWLAEHAPLPMPASGCGWLLPAPGCAQSAWACVYSWADGGAAAGAWGRDAVFGTDPAELRRRAAEASRGRTPPLDPDDGPAAEIRVDPDIGRAFGIAFGRASRGGPTYEACARAWQEAHASECPDACRARVAQGDAAAWPGLPEARAACVAAAEKAAAYEETDRNCVVVRVDACTGMASLDCPGATPRYATASFLQPAPEDGG